MSIFILRKLYKKMGNLEPAFNIFIAIIALIIIYKIDKVKVFFSSALFKKLKMKRGD